LADPDGLPTLVVTHQLQVERRTGKVRRSTIVLRHQSARVVTVNNYDFNSLLTYLPMYSQLSGVCGRLVAKFVRAPAGDAASPAMRLPSLGSHVGTSVWLWLVSPLARE